MFVQPGVVEQLLAVERHARQQSRLRQERARLRRTYIDPSLPTAKQQAILCRKQLNSCRQALGMLKAGKEAESSVKDIEVLQDKLKVMHLNVMLELSGMETKLLQKGACAEIVERHEEFCRAVESRYREFDRLLSLVRHNQPRRDKVRRNLADVVEFLSSGNEKDGRQSSSQRAKGELPRHAATFSGCRPGRPPFFQWPWLLAAGEPLCYSVLGEMARLDSATGPPDSNDLVCDSPEVNFDPNDSDDSITAKAAQLGYNPVRIFEFVRNELVYEPYFGSVKGAKRVLAEGGGNDMDIAGVLIALLRAGSIPCRYVCGTVELSMEQAANWVGVKDAANVVEFFQKNGICLEEVTYAGGEPAKIVIDHVWVKAYVDNFPYRGAFRRNDYEPTADGDAWVDLDASFKQHKFTANRDIEQSIGIDFDPDTLLSNSLFDATVVEEANEKYVFGINEELIAEQLLLVAGPLRNYLAAKKLTTETIFRQRHVSEERYGILPVSDAYRIVDRAVSFSTLPDELRHRLTMTLKNPDGSVALSVTRPLATLAGKAVTLLYEPAGEEHAENLADPCVVEDPNLCPAYLISLRPRLKIDDELLPEQPQQAPTVGMGRRQKLLLTFESPDGTEEQVVHQVVAGAMQSLVLDAQRITGDELSEQYAVVNGAALRLQADDSLSPCETIGAVLRGIGLSYLHQMDRFNQVTAGCLGLAVTRQPSMVRVGWEPDVIYLYGDPNLPYEACSGGVKIAVVRDVHSAAAIESAQPDTLKPENRFLFTSALTASALEDNALMQALPSGRAVSTAHLIRAANGRQGPDVPIYTITTAQEANSLTALPQYVTEDIKDAVNAGCEVTILEMPIQISGAGDSNYVGYIKRDVDTGASDFVVYDATLEKVTGSEQKNDLITPVELLLDCCCTCDRYDDIKAVVTSAAKWLKVVEGATTNTGLSYLPAIVDINRWFQTRAEFDPVTTVASVLAVTGPMAQLSQQAGIFNVQAGAGSNGQLEQYDWVSADANEFIIRADVTHDAAWQADIYRSGQSEPYFDPCTGGGSNLQADFNFQQADDGYYRYVLSAGADANTAVPVEGAFRVDMTEPGAVITDVNTPDANIRGFLIVKGTAWDEFFGRYEVSVSQDGEEVVVFGTAQPRESETVLCQFSTSDFNDGSAEVILRVWDLAGNVASDSELVTITNPDHQAPVVDFSGLADGNDISAETLVDGAIEISLAPTDPNEKIARIELWWCDQEQENCRLIAVEADANGLPVDVNSAEPWQYNVDSYLFENGPSRLVAYTADMFGNVATSTLDFFNHSMISGFRVTPAVVTAPQTQAEVRASLTESAQWTLIIYDSCDVDVADFFGSGAMVVEEVDVSSFDDGAYYAHLTVGAREANAAFVVALGAPVALISNLKDNSQLDETERGALPIVDEGLFELFGAAYHAACPTADVEYKVQLFKPQVGPYAVAYWNDPYGGLYQEYFVKCITPGEPNIDGFSRICAPPVGSLGTLDFTGVKNGTYRMLLSVRYGTSVADANVAFVLDSPLKLGNVKFTQQDLVVDAGNVPLRVTRTYDSLNRQVEADFGFGWSYSIANMDVVLAEQRELMRSLSDNEQIPVRVAPDYDRNVTLTLPDGTRATFLFYLEAVQDSYTAGYSTGLYYHQAKYASPPGVAATLRTLQPEIMDPYGYWSSARGTTGSAAIPQYYDFSGFVLTTADGTEYYIKRKSYGLFSEYVTFLYNNEPVLAKPYGPPYLSHIVTTGGERIEFDLDFADEQQPVVKNVIAKDSQGNQVNTLKLDRDANDRVSAVWAPAQDKEAGDPCSLYYRYDDCGNLAEVHRLVRQDPAEYETTYYFYDNPASHFITDINDARGLTPIQYVYDNQGRLTKVIDAKGNAIELSHDIEGRSETVYDRSFKYATTYLYNERGNVEAVVNPLGEVTTYQYNDLGYGEPGDYYYVGGNPDRPTEITDPLGNTTCYQYDRKGRTTKITDAEGNVTENYYDDNGNLTLSRQLAPDAENPDELIEISRTTNKYDSKSRLTKTTDALGHTNEYFYDQGNNLLETSTKVTDANTGELVDVVTKYTYGDANAPHSPNSITGPDGLARYFAYDESGNQTKSWYEWQDVNDPNNSCTVVNITEYDAMGRAFKTKRKITNASGEIGESEVTLSESCYNSIGKPDIVIDQHGGLTKYEYDQLGNLVEIRVYESEQIYNQDVNYPDPNNCLTVSRTLYDKEGRAVVTVGPYDPAGPNVPATETVYGPAGRVIRTRKWADVQIPLTEIAEGKTNTLTAAGEPNWSRGRLISVSETKYDQAGRVVKTRIQDENGDWQTTTYQYDGAGRQTAVINPEGYRTEYEYQGNRRTLMRDALDRETQFIHDALGRVVSTVYPDGTYTYTDYDELGRRLAETDQAGRTRYFEYDKAGRLAAVILPDVNDPCNNDTPAHPRYEYEYDDYGNLIRIKDNIKQDPDSGLIDANDSRQTIFTYGPLGSQKTRKLAAGQVECKEYDSLGRVAKAVDFKGQVTGYEYDSRGLPAYQRFYDNNSLYPDEPELQYEFGYDKSGRRTAVEVNDFEGEPAIYKTSYDAEGKVQYIESPQGFVAYEYHDTTGRQKSVRTPKENADTKVYYYYDSLGRLCEVNVAKRNNIPANESTYYSYNPVGSVGSVLYANGNLAEYTYDSLDRLTDLTNWQSSARQNVLSSYEYTLSADGQRTAAAETLAGATTYINWSYDALNRLAAEDYNAPDDANDFTHEYVYDVVGNRLSKTVNDANVTQYSYNNNDQLTEEVTDGNVSSYEYDDNGALVKKDAGGDPNHYYSYDLRGRLAQLQVENGVTLSYLYNPDGIRVRAAVQAGSTTDYLIDPYNHTGYAQVLKEVGDSNTVYIYGLDAIAQAAGASEPKYLLYDGHGSVRQLSNNIGNSIASYSYDAYGSAHGFNPGEAATKLLYTGEFYDSHSGFYYNRARWYNPSVGRFNRLDPFAGSNRDPQSLHKYLYAHCNPINGMDPSGSSFILDFTIQNAIRGSIAAVAFSIISFTAAKLRGATWGQALWQGVKTAGITGFAFMSPLFAWSLVAVTPVLVGLGIYSGDITGEDVPEIAAYVAAGIALILLFKSARYSVWEVRTAIRLKLPRAANNLRTGHSVRPRRNLKWRRAIERGDKQAQGSLLHGELADLMRAENMTNLGVEVSYNDAGVIVRYGRSESIRLDYTVYRHGRAIKVIDLKPSDVIKSSRVNQICQFLELSSEDVEALSYGSR